jgi:hypothetical protein
MAGGTGYVPDPVEEVADAIRKTPDTEAGFDLLVPTNGPPGQVPPRTRRRYRFADQMMLSIAFGGYDPDEEKARQQLDLVRQAAEEFSELVDEIFDLYCKRRGIESTEQGE